MLVKLNFNMVVFGLLMLATLIFGPTFRILELGTQATGGFVGDFFQMSLFTQATATSASKWVNAWTVFYWLWPLAWSPFAGLFIARISRGRSVREVAFAGIGAISALHFGIAPHDLTMVLGSMGASAVLLYGAPAAPFSQPRNLFLGHGIACVVGVTAHELISVPMDTPILAAPLAVSGSIVLMHLTRSLHPPAGGTVLIAVLGSPELHALGYSLLVPTMLDATVLFGVALANNAFGIRYQAR